MNKLRLKEIVNNQAKANGIIYNAFHMDLFITGQKFVLYISSGKELMNT